MCLCVKCIVSICLQLWLTFILNVTCSFSYSEAQWYKYGAIVITMGEEEVTKLQEITPQKNDNHNQSKYIT